jgi:hypothetical protein
VVGCLALYALHRRLLPRNVKPDSSLHRAMWAVQKTVPMVVLGPKTVLFVGEFLAQHAPLEVSRLDPPNPVAHRRTALAAFDGALGPQAAAAAAQCSAWCVVKTHRSRHDCSLLFAHHDGFLYSTHAPSFNTDFLLATLSSRPYPMLDRYVLAEAKLQPSLRYEASMPAALALRGALLLKVPPISPCHTSRCLCMQSGVASGPLTSPPSRSLASCRDTRRWRWRSVRLIWRPPRSSSTPHCRYIAPLPPHPRVHATTDKAQSLVSSSLLHLSTSAPSHPVPSHPRPVIPSSRHPVIPSSRHPVIPSSCHPVWQAPMSRSNLRDVATLLEHVQALAQVQSYLGPI